MPRPAAHPSLADQQAAPGGVAAVDRALTLLLAFGPGEDTLGLAELARRTGLYKSTALRLIASLLHAGFLARQGEAYTLGPALRRDMLDLVKAMQQQRRLTVVMVTHQPEDALAAASHTAYLENGRIVALRPTAELFAAQDLAGLRAYLGDWSRPAL